MSVIDVDDKLPTNGLMVQVICVCVKPRESSRVLLLLLSLLRLVLIPVFLLSNIVVPNRRFSVLIYTDAVPIIAEFLLGFSNGYIGTLAMMYGPQ